MSVALQKLDWTLRITTISLITESPFTNYDPLDELEGNIINSAVFGAYVRCFPCHNQGTGNNRQICK